MTAWISEQLPWLLRAPDDFRAQCSRLDTSTGDASTALALLGSFALNGDQLLQLGKSIERLTSGNRTTQSLSNFSLAVLGNGTTDLFVPALAASAIRHGIRLSVVSAEYGQLMQEALDPGSRINTARCDAVLLAFSHHALPLPLNSLTSGDDAAVALATVTDFFDTLRKGIGDGSGATTIVQTVAPPSTGLLGHLDRRTRGTVSWLIAALNEHIAMRAQERGDYLLDVAALAAEVGLENWQDPAQWNLYKLTFSQRYVPLYADHVGRLIGAIRGKSRKCLVLDLDNTLWGGVVGDDGISGITIGQGDGRGEAFVEIQKTALALRERGIVLAVCSKNDDKIAREPFQRHPDMVLKESHFAVFQANWHDKASNLRAIADALELGLDSLVFIDDNPAERMQVRLELPMVAVPELSDDPAFYSRAILSAGYFEAVTFVDADRQRALQYEQNAQRAELASTASSINSYLDALKMTICFDNFNEFGLDRITQLINKTNQFNLTTRRYTASQVRAFAEDQRVYTLQVRLQDRFGDNGLIGAVICREQGDSWVIDTWLMSCRVLRRRVEEAILEKLSDAARIKGIEKLIGVYLPTAKNGMVRNHYATLGFIPADGTSVEDETTWQLILTDRPTKKLPFAVEDSTP